MEVGCTSIWTIYSASAFRELWKKEGEQDARLNSVERKHEGLEREHNILTREHKVHHGGGEDDQKTLILSPPFWYK
jgi:hypothetical protein